MAHAQAAFLCNSVLAHETGTFSALGIGIREWMAPQLPFVATPTFVALIEWSDDEAGALHAFSCSVMHADGEVVSRSDGQTQALPRSGVLPSTTSAFMSVPFEARRAGLYTVEFRVDGDVVVSLPLNVTTTLPPIH